MIDVFLRSIVVVSALGLGACGTSYVMPELSDTDREVAERVLAEEQSLAPMPQGNASVSIQNFRTVVARVEPVAEQFCKVETDEGTDCDIIVELDRDMSQPANAFQSYRDGRPVVTFNARMVAEARNQDELAFILGHEMGHHMADHITKKGQQQLAGALILGTLMAVADAQNPYTPQSVRNQNMENAMVAGAGVGGMAYSQTYELEADMIGTHIAEAAGYDAELGSRVFARRKSAKNADGALSFWGTHPPSDRRVATVAATARKISEGEPLLSRAAAN